MAGVILENVSRVYPGHVWAVKGIDLEVFDREFFVLLGPSGCGKTTTLRLVAGLDECSTGRIVVGSRVVDGVPPKDRGVAMAFQNYALYPHLTVRGNLAFGLELRERVGGLRWLWSWVWPPRRRATWASRRLSIEERVRQTARSLGIEGKLDCYPRQLSGGERQRVAVGRALVRDPAVFLFDEPLSNLDATLRAELRQELKQLHLRRQTTMVYVTHDQVEAMTLGQRIAVMSEGTIQQVGSPLEVYDWPANRFVAGFIGTPAMNFIAGELVSVGEAWQFRWGEWTWSIVGRVFDLSLPGTRPAVLGVRPEDVRIEREAKNLSGGVRGTVSLVELLGDASVVTVALDTGAGARAAHQDEAACVMSKLKTRTDLRAGDTVSVQFDMTKVHVFNPSNGKNWVRNPRGS